MAAGGGGKGKGSSGGSGTDKDKKDKPGGGNNENGTQPRDPAGPSGGISGGSESGPGAKSGGNGKGGGGGGQNGPKKPGMGYVDAIDDPVAKKNQEVNADAQDLDEEGWFDSWGSFFDHLGKFVGGGVGLGEREQTFTETANDMAYGGAAPADGDTTNDAHWGWDPVVAAANMAGSVLGGIGAGTVTGTIADALSEEAGRPFDIDLGTDVLGGSESSDTADTEGGGGNPGDTSTDGDPGGGGGQDNEEDPVVSVPKPAQNEKPDTGDQTTPDTTQPKAGVGIDLVTQTNNVQNGGGVSVPDASKRRRRGTLGGLGLGGLAI